ncbi:hypothetical protein [Streptococcus oricebi]|nr:hypothetical protein [Streptococcus oricebi]
MKKTNFAALDKYQTVKDLKEVKGGFTYPKWASDMIYRYCRMTRW